MRKCIFICFLMVLALAAFPARATNGLLSSFESAYPATVGTRIDSCTLCHTSAPTRNSYGTAYANAGHDFKSIEPLDSDGDGSTNLEEITALTSPGNASDYTGSQQSTGCAGCAGSSGQKGTFSLDGILKILSDLFTAGLALVTLRLMSRRM